MVDRKTEKYLKQIHSLSEASFQYDDASKQWGCKSGIYAIWGNKKLADILRRKSIFLHTSKTHNANQEVELSFAKAIGQAVKIKGKFCLYVGKTVDFEKRQKIRRFEKLLKPQNETGKALLGSTTLKELKDMLAVSFIKEKKWIDRFFLENIAIGLLRPVLNTQPER